MTGKLIDESIMQNLVSKASTTANFEESKYLANMQLDSQIISFNDE
jgi:hypothetical protein